MKKILFIAIIALISNPVFAKKKTTCESQLFNELDTDYNYMLDEDELNTLYNIVFSDEKKSCPEALKIVQKQKAPNPSLGKVNTAPSPHFAPPPKFPDEPNTLPQSKSAPSRYID